MKVITFYTPEYLLQVDAWSWSVNGLHDYHAFEVPTQGSWRLNCGMKPAFILDMLRTFHEPVLWVDVDGRFKRRWDLDLDDTADFAIWFIPNKVMKRQHVPGGDRENDGLASGTMWFNYTEASLRFLENWKEIEDGQGNWEQQILGDVWYNHKPETLRTCQLPQQYCKVFDAPWFTDGEDHDTVIEHTQASRKLRKVVNHGVSIRQ